MKKIFSGSLGLVCAGLLLLSTSAQAQNNVGKSGNDLLGRGARRVITTAVPFLSITPDARAGGMGDAGVATTSDANCLHWNPAKLAFLENAYGFSASYTPWLRALVPDISLSYLSGYYKIDNLSGFGAALRYFSLGDIQFTDNYGNDLRTYRPNEFSTDLGYARKLSDNFSIGVAGRFVYSDLAGKVTLNGTTQTKPAIGFGGDISGYYKTKGHVNEYKTDLGLGFNISNMGPKVTYTNETQRDFIPINMRIGGYYNIHIDEFNELAFALDFNKLLVPTQPVYSLDSLGNRIPVAGKPGEFEIAHGKNPKVPVIQGMLQSFGDAPDGFSEEISEINTSFGMEYWYDRQFAGRLGYFYEAPTKGNRQYLTLGASVKYNILQFDFAYLVSTNSTTTISRNPLDNTLRFTLQFNFAQKGKGKKATTPVVTPDGQ